MAYAMTPAPGTKLGPCAKPCEHRDCRESRNDAATVCPRCKEAIGYERPWTSYNLFHWHTTCLQKEADAGRLGKMIG